MKAVLIILLFTFGLVACTIQNTKQPVQNDLIVCHYYTRMAEMPFSAGCFMLMNDTSSSLEVDHPVNDTVISDMSLLDSISRMVSSLQKEKESDFGNACVVCMLEYHGKRALICIDWFSNILVDHKPMIRNDTLTFYIKQNIGFYEYYTPEDGVLLEWFPEYKSLMKHKDDQ